MAEEIGFHFVDEGVGALAEMLWELAPQTCEAISEVLPVRGLARHAIYSGSEVFLVLPELLALPKEHATSIVGPGDVAFAWFQAGTSYRLEEDLSEICWFYDLDATPSMPEGPVPVNVFARLHDADAFFGVCRRMRVDGAKPLEIRRR
jgi:Protein of unknown function (DUF3830)